MSKEKIIRQARTEYFRQYRLKNKEKVQQHTENFWIRQAHNQALEVRAMQEQDSEANGTG